MSAPRPLTALIVLCAFSGVAMAAGEGEKQVAASLGFAMADVEGKARTGVQVGVEATKGLTDSWAGHVGVSYALLPGPPPYRLHHLTTVALGATYSLDVLRWVPFLDLGLSVADLRSSADGSQYLGPQVGLGVDYLLTRGWSLAALAHFDYLAVRLHGSGDSRPWLTTIGLRLGRTSF
jgi:hypothetical protein